MTSKPMHAYQLIEWIEAEASRGMAEGDTRDALNAIKWKIKDYNAAHKEMREHYRKHPISLDPDSALSSKSGASDV